MPLNSMIPSWVSPDADESLMPNKSSFDIVFNLEQLNPLSV
jgi:hypothetical protein